MIRSGVIFKEEKEPLINEVDAMYSMALDPAYYIATLPDYLSEIRISNLLKDSTKKEKSHIQMAKEMDDIVKESETSKEQGAIVNPLLDCQMGDSPVEVIPTMISTIDSHMYGGLGVGEFGLICGITGLGKTTLAVNFCWGAAKLGFPTALITLELPAKKISERLYSRISEIPYNRIRSGDDGNMEDVRREMWEKISLEDDETRSRFQIWDYSQESCTITMIENRLKDLKKKNKLPKMLFLDWLDALGTDPGERRGGVVLKELRHLLQSYSQGISELANRYKIAIWATTQSNGKGENQQQVRMTNASEGFGKSFRCSVFLGIGATDEDRLENRLTVTAGKMRDGMIFSAQIEARLDIQKFSDISVNLEDDVANFVPRRR